MASINNGAEGFMFSVSEKTLSILKLINRRKEIDRLKLHALVPYAYEYVRLATQVGGIPGLARKLAKQIVVSGNLKVIARGLTVAATMDPISLMKAYLTYEISRIKSSAGRQANLGSVILHEIITDMALALGLDWLFKSYVDFILDLGITPGFETRNFVYLVDRFKEWSMDFKRVVIATPFNKMGFQMNPSKTECDETLASLHEPNVIAMSVLAAGYLKPSEAISYIKTLPNVKAIVVGVSKERHARETFKFFREEFQ
jgi:hypothetical protein